MIRKYVLPIIALLGLILGIRVVIMGGKPLPVAEPVAQPPAPPFQSYVAGSGMIESSSENIRIASPVAGVVSSVDVSVGSQVNQGAPLFHIDDREIRAQLEVSRAAKMVADTELANSQDQLALLQRVSDRAAISADELTRRTNAVRSAQAKVAQAQAAVLAAETEIDRRVICSPIDGQVLQLKTRVGEFVPTQVLTTPLLLLGRVNPLHVRVDIDETDAWRVTAGARAVGMLRGNPDIKAPLEFVRFEPYVIPKVSLTGESTERVDTRVLQAIYRFKPEEFPAYVGQLVDVFIDGSPAS